MSSGSGTGTLLSSSLDSTVTLENFYLDLRAHLPGCPDLLFDRQLVDAIRQFCDQTWAWTHKADLSVISGTQEYTLSDSLTLPTGSEIMGLFKIEDSDGNEYTAYEYDLVLDEFILNQEPSADQALTITCVLRPQLGVSEVPPWIYNQHKETIMSGVCKQMMLEPNKAWTNYELGERHRRLFERGLARTKIDRIKGYTKGSDRVRRRKVI